MKIALAPAMKHRACSLSEYVCRPAASLIIDVGKTMRAVAIVRRIVVWGRGWIYDQLYCSEDIAFGAYMVLLERCSFYRYQGIHWE